MSDWYYSEKHDVMRNVKDIKRTTENTDSEVKRLKKQVEEMTRNQEVILKAFAEMAHEMAAMREEMYPSVKSTKPAFDAPKNSKNGIKHN